MAGHSQETALTNGPLHRRRWQPEDLQGTKPVISSPMSLLKGMGGWVVYLVGRSLFLLTLGKKGTALYMFTESPMCSLRHEDRAHPYKSGWRQNKNRKKWAGRAAETVCVRVCAQPARGMTLTLFQRKVIAQTINLKHLGFASFVFVNSFL